MSTQYTRWQDLQRSTVAASRTALIGDLRMRLHQSVIEQLGPLLSEGRLGPTELQRRVAEMLPRALADEQVALSEAERRQLIADISDDVLGYGPIDRYLHDDTVSEVMCNGPHRVYVEKAGRLMRTDTVFIDETHLRRVIDKIVGQVGRHIDESNPLVDARLPDGSRINAVVPPLAVGGPYLTVRKFSKDAYGISDLVAFGTVTPKVAHFLDACVRGQLNIVVSGGTSSGKTTLLNVLSSFIPQEERVVTIEDAKELRLLQDHVCSLEARPANIEGVGAISIRDLVRNALRMRPDRIVVGECRGPEALDMLQAMNTGHDGSLTTVHANSPRDALSRVETLTLMAGLDLPIRAVREQIAGAIDLIVQVARLRDGSRRVTHIAEVVGLEGDVLVLQDLYMFDFAMGLDERGRFLGALKSTGLRPAFAERLANRGVTLEAGLFATEQFAGRPVR